MNSYKDEEGNWIGLEIVADGGPGGWKIGPEVCVALRSCGIVTIGMTGSWVRFTEAWLEGGVAVLRES